MRSRTAEDSKINHDKSTPFKTGLTSSTVEEHPHTDTIIQNIMNKNNPKSTSNIHKPNMEVKKKEPVESVEDILARRMREQLAASQTNLNN